MSLDNPYRIRQQQLEALGFVSYEAYLRSALWRSIRARVLGKCICCGRKGNTVHHASYDAATMRGERVDTLLCVCRGCHRQAERQGKRHPDPADRLSAATAFLLCRQPRQVRPSRRLRRPTGEVHMLSHSQHHAAIAAARMSRKRRKLLKAPVALAPFNPTPRLVKRKDNS